MLQTVLLTALAIGSAGGKAITCSVPTVPLRSQAEYVAGTPGIPPTLAVTFNKIRPSSEQAESVLRACISALAKTVRVNGELLANAWYNPAPTGSTANDEGPLPLRDGSLHLSFDPKTGRIRTWNEREGVRPMMRDDPKGEYFTEYTEEKIVVPPYGKFASLDVVFVAPPPEAVISTTLIAEVKRAVQRQTTKLNTTAYAKTGPRGNKAAQRQVRGSNGKFIGVEFDSKDGQIRTLEGKILGSIR